MTVKHPACPSVLLTEVFRARSRTSALHAGSSSKVRNLCRFSSARPLSPAATSRRTSQAYCCCRLAGCLAHTTGARQRSSCCLMFGRKQQSSFLCCFVAECCTYEAILGMPVPGRHLFFLRSSREGPHIPRSLLLLFFPVGDTTLLIEFWNVTK